MATHPFPEDHKHQSILSVDYADKDYENIEAGDAEYLSIGRSRWNHDDLSVKVFRWTNKGDISPFSEEMPMSRALDMAIFIADQFRRTNVAKDYFGKDIEKHRDASILYDYFEKYNDTFNKQLDELKTILNK